MVRKKTTEELFERISEREREDMSNYYTDEDFEDEDDEEI